MTKQDIINNLIHDMTHGRIKNIKLLKELCEPHGIDAWDEIVFARGWNACDKCGALGDTELDLFWIDGFNDWEENNPDDQAFLRAYEKEPEEYCCICWDCFEDLKRKGKELHEEQ